MFDGPDVWGMEEPLRDTVMKKMLDAIRSWDVTSRRNINYRSEVARRKLSRLVVFLFLPGSTGLH
jgi:hypothetical protein